MVLSPSSTVVSTIFSQLWQPSFRQNSPVATLALMGAMACVAAACSPSAEPLSQSAFRGFLLEAVPALGQVHVVAFHTVQRRLAVHGVALKLGRPAREALGKTRKEGKQYEGTEDDGRRG